MDRKSKMITFVLILGFLAILLFSPNISAHDKGKGDMTNEYNCVNSCHRTESESGVIKIGASASEVMVGGELSLTVTVTNTEQSPGEVIGVFLVLARSAEESIPQDAGWTVVEDPNGGAHNYVEKPADASGGEVFTWKLKAPDEPGEFTFYSREDHGNGDKYFLDTEEGIAVNVIPDPDQIQEDPGSGNVDGGDTGNNHVPDTKGNETSSEENPDDDPVIGSEPKLVPLMLGILIAGIIVIITYLMRY